MQPHEIEQQIGIAHRHIAAGRFGEGAAICDQIIALGHKHPEALYLLALVAYQSGHDVELSWLLRIAITQKPNDARFYSTMGDYFHIQGKNREAADCFRRAAQLSPGAPSALCALGDALQEMKETDEAEAIYRSALKAAPDERAALMGLGQILLLRGKPADAARCLEHVLARHPEDAVAMARLGAALAAQGRTEEAQRFLLEAVDRAPRHPEAHKTLGDLAHAAGCLEEATEHYWKHFEYKHSLVALAEKFRTDKWGSHYYAQHYHKHFFPLRDREINILEIGVGGYDHPLRGGASLRMWKAFFPKGKVFAIDIHDKSAIEEERIRIFHGSQDDPEFLKKVAADIGRIDIIVDDGSHINRHIIETFKILFPLLADDGIYAVEDTQTAYWPTYGGSSADLNHPDSALSFFKGLTDGLNYEEFLLPGYSPSYFDQRIIAMHFYHNMVFLYKGENKEGSNFVRNGVLSL